MAFPLQFKNSISKINIKDTYYEKNDNQYKSKPEHYYKGILIGILLTNIYVVVMSGDMSGFDVSQLLLLVAAIFWLPSERCSKKT